MKLEKNASELTILAYQYDLKAFKKFLAIMNIEPELCNITTMDLRRYINYLKLEKQFANETIRRKIHSLSIYFKFLLLSDNSTRISSSNFSTLFRRYVKKAA